MRHCIEQSNGLVPSLLCPSWVDYIIATRAVSLLAISLSHLEQHWKLQLELPLGLEDENRRPGSQRGMARWTADRAIDLIRDRFGWDAVGYGSVMLGLSRSVPDEFRELAENDL
jgi:DNA polymerase IV